MNSKAQADYELSKLDFNRDGIEDDLLKDLYKRILLPRMIEEKMLSLLRQGKISKWFAGIGQEAIAVGTTMAMQPDEYMLPMHRNLGVFTTRDIPLERLFKQWQGKEGGFTKGRDRSFHFGSEEYNICGMISHLGPQMGIADGIGLAEQLSDSGRCTLVFTGEGGTSEGDFHEALNVASVWDLPVLFVIENNGYGLSTPVTEQYNCERLADRGQGYGMEAVTIDGNNVLDVYKTIDYYARTIRDNSRPILIECMTFRMRGHEEASGTKYVPNDLMQAWSRKDPVENYEQFLINQQVLSREEVSDIRDAFKQQINKAWKAADAAPLVEASLEKELGDVFAPHESKEKAPANGSRSKKRFVDALSEGLQQAMEKHPNLILMGQDIADYGGVFKITQGLVELFGKDRVRNTPLCESAILGAALGLSLRGYKSMVEMQFADFVSSGFNQIVNNLAKIHYRWGPNADVVVRMPTGAGVGAGPFHSQSNEGWFSHTPGLKIVYPSNPYDAKGLLLAAFEDPNPVMYFEHKLLYRTLQEEFPDGYYTVPLGQANIIQKGGDLTIITYGAGVQWAKEAVANHEDYNIEIVDLRTLQPLDWDTVYDSVKRNNKVLLLHEDTLTGGIGGELAARITENCFEHLDGPVTRVASLDTPVPFAKDLEAQFLGKSRLDKALGKLLEF